VAAGWIADIESERQRGEQRQHSATKAPDDLSCLTAKKIIAIVEELGDMVTALRDAAAMAVTTRGSPHRG
jgi:hypothetical protein